MKIQSIESENFKKYGTILTGYDFDELFKSLAGLYIPDSGITYSASVDELEQCSIKEELQNRGFGGLPIQIGYVGGVNGKLDCLEYHKSSEFNITLNDIILVLGCVNKIKDNEFDLKNCEAFFVPGGTGVELYGTTLHYAPFSCDCGGYRTVCVLPYGTNGEKKTIQIKTTEDKMYFGTNKWIMAHKDATEENPGVYVGLVGENIIMEGLER